MRIPVNNEKVRLQGMNYSPVSGAPAEAFGVSSARGLAEIGGGLSRLGAAIGHAEEKRDEARQLQALNEQIEKMNEIDNTIQKDYRLGNAENATEYFNSAEAKARAEVLAKYKINNKERFNYMADKMKITAKDRVQTFQEAEREKELNLATGNQDKLFYDKASTSGNPNDFASMVQNIVVTANDRYGKVSKEAVTANVRERITKTTTDYVTSRLNAGDAQGAVTALNSVRPLMEPSVYNGLEKMTGGVIEAQTLDKYTKEIYAASGGSREKIAEHVMNSNYHDKGALLKSANKYADEIDGYKKGIVIERKNKLYTEIFTGDIKSYADAKARLAMSGLEGNELITADNSLKKLFGLDEDGIAKNDDIRTIQAFEERLAKGELTADEIVNGVNSGAIKSTTGISYIKKLPVGEKPSEMQLSYYDTGTAILRNAGLSDSNLAAASTLLIKDARFFKTEQDAINKAKSIVENKLYSADNFKTSIENRTAAKAEYERSYGVASVDAISKITKSFGKDVEDWGADKHWQATSGLLDKTRKTTNSEISTTDYQILLQSFMNAMQQSADRGAPIVYTNEKDFMGAWERFLILYGKKNNIPNLFVPLQPEQKTQPVQEFTFKFPDYAVGT